MKTLCAVIVLVSLAACSEPPEKSQVDRKEMPVEEVTGLLAESTSSWTGKAEQGKDSDEEHYFDLTAEQFESLKHGFPAALKEVAQKEHGYDLFSDRGTVLNPQLSTFTFKMGAGSQFHYVIHGVRAELSETKPNTVITVSRTTEGG